MCHMTVALDLPAGLTARPLVPADASAVTAVVAAQELADVGEVLIDDADFIADWQRPGYDVSSGTVGVCDEGRLVAYAEVAYGDRGDAASTPPTVAAASVRGLPAGCNTRPRRRATR